MSVNFGNMPSRAGDWAWFKVMLAAKYILVQYAQDPGSYLVYGYDGPEVLSAQIWTGDVPPGVVAGGYSQEQNDADLADFEANYKPTANGPLERRETDGRIATRTIAATQGNLYRMRVFSFTTATPGSLVNRKPDGSDHGDAVYSMLDANGAATEVAGDCTTTIVDFEPPYDVELIGGAMDVDGSLIGAATADFWAASIGAPDVPGAYGGSIDYLSRVSCEMVTDGKIRLDGRATYLMRYDPVNHTGKLRVLIAHPAGAAKRFQVWLETFRSGGG